MKTILLFASILFAALTIAQNPNKLYPVKNTNKKHGYINSKGEMTVDFIYDWVGEFDKYDQGMVRKGDLYGLIDRTGKIVIPIEQPGFFYQVGDYYIVVDWSSENKTKSVFDKDGKSVDAQHIQSAYERKLEGIGDLFVVRPDKKTGVVSLDGQFAIEAKHNSIHAGEDHFLCFDRNLRTMHNKHGKLLFQTKYSIERMTTIGENRIPFRDSTGYAGYLDTLGQVIIPVQFAEARPFSNGRAMVKNVKNEWAIIDLEGNIIGDFSSKRTKFEFVSMSKDRKFGVINMKGETVIPNKYSGWFNFCNNRAFAPLDWEGNFQLIDTTGKVIGKFKGQFDGYNPTCFDANGIIACGYYDDATGAQYEQYVTRDGKVIWKAGPFYECFPKDAELIMADGTTKKISEALVGDELFSETGSTIVEGIEVHTGRFPLLKIKVLNSTSLLADLSDIENNGAQELLVTYGHPILTPEGPIRASALREGQTIIMKDDQTGEITSGFISSIRTGGSTSSVWNLKTSSEHYFVNGIMVKRK